MISALELLEICPLCPKDKAELYAAKLSESMEEAGCVFVTRAAAYIAQWAHETDQFRAMSEYASGAAYEGRKDLGNTQKGDGRRYKGRGVAMVTGRDNYWAFGDAMNQGTLFLREPERVATPEWAFRAAAWYWNAHNLNKYADALDFRGLTKKINGGLNGYDNRLAFYVKALQVLGLTANV